MQRERRGSRCVRSIVLARWQGEYELKLIHRAAQVTLAAACESLAEGSHGGAAPGCGGSPPWEGGVRGVAPGCRGGDGEEAVEDEGVWRGL